MFEQEQFYAEIESKLLDADMRGEARGLKRGMELAIKTWLSNRKDIMPNTQRLPIIGEVVESFNLDEDLAGKIVNDFFEDVLAAKRKMQILKLEREQFYAEIEAYFIEARKQGEARGLRRAEARAEEEGMELAIKTWLSNRKDFMPNTQRLPIIDEVVESFNLDEDLAEKIVNDFFDENLTIKTIENYLTNQGLR